MHKLVYKDTGEEVKLGQAVELPYGKRQITRRPVVAGFKAIMLDGKPHDIDDISAEWREFPDAPPAAIMERTVAGIILHGPFASDAHAVEWASSYFNHGNWHCAPLHKPE